MLETGLEDGFKEHLKKVLTQNQMQFQVRLQVVRFSWRTFVMALLCMYSEFTLLGTKGT